MTLWTFHFTFQYSKLTITSLLYFRRS